MTGMQHFNTKFQFQQFRVGLVALNRPKALNALCGPLMQELTQALDEWDKVVLSCEAPRQEIIMMWF